MRVHSVGNAGTVVRTEGAGESGFALILALLALVLLTFLGLTLALTTSTELQIATNYRWSQQALYNAESGLEAGRALLRNMNWALVLPAPRQPNLGGQPANTGCVPTRPGMKCWLPNATTAAVVAPVAGVCDPLAAG